MRTRLILLLAPLALAGCAITPHHRCRLGVYNPECHSMQDVYNKAIRAPADVSDMQQVMKADPSHPLPRGAVPAPVGNNGSGYTDPGKVGEPVFQEPQVHRVWIAPYVDADGNLRSGEYTYFSTPGAWAYGSLRSPGDASASTMFAPTKSNALGFKPDIIAKPGQTPPVPGSTIAPSSDSSAITPPAEKLTQQ